MAGRIIVGIILIFIGLVIVISGLREFIQILIIEQIPVIGDIIQLIAPSALEEQLIHVLVGILLILAGGFIAKRKKK